MRKVLSVLVCMLMIYPALATGDATPTSKGYVDAQMATLQDNLPGAAANTVITTTATAGETGTKAIYDASGNYAEQQNALVTAEDANTAIQMAIQGEMVCTEYDPTGQYCYVYSVKNGPNLAIAPARLENSTYDASTGIMTNTWAAPRTYLQLFLDLYNDTDYHSVRQIVFRQDIRTPRLVKQTFTTNADMHFLLIKHNDSQDILAWFPVEPLTTYTVLVDVLEANPSVVGGLKMKLMLVRGEWDSNLVLAPGENIYLPQGN